MPKTYREREYALYEPVRLILLDKFKDKGEEIHLEDTHNGVFSPELKEALEFMALHILRVEKMSPDLIGYIQKLPGIFDRIIVEIKARKIRIKDVFQAKMYADVLNANYCILVSSESLTREMREFIDKRNLLFRTMNKVIISKYQDNDVLIEPLVLKELYYGTLPVPFNK